MVCRVVCGRFDVIATLVPTSALVSVDLPVFGLPTKQTKPERNSVTARIPGPIGDDDRGVGRQLAHRSHARRRRPDPPTSTAASRPVAPLDTAAATAA